LWRLRRATAIESGLFKIQARHLLQFKSRVIDVLRQARMGAAAELVENGVQETLTYYAFPDLHWQKIRTNNARADHEGDPPANKGCRRIS
jgi:transposase-like protein